jgi:hypothetical protein
VVWCIGVVLPVNFTGGALNEILAATGAAAADEPPAIQLGPGKSQDSLAQELANNTWGLGGGQSGRLLELARVGPAPACDCRGRQAAGGRPQASRKAAEAGRAAATGGLGEGGLCLCLCRRRRRRPGRAAFDQKRGSALPKRNAPPRGSYIFSSLDKLSMANVPAGSPRLWVHLASVWLVSIIAMRLLWRYSTEAVELRYR